MQCADGQAVQCKVGSYRSVVTKMWEDLAVYKADAILRPDYYICAGARVMDFSGSVALEQILMLMDVEMQTVESDQEVILIGSRNAL